MKFIAATSVVLRLRAGLSARSWLPIALLFVPLIYFPVARIVTPRQGIWASTYQFNLISAWPLISLVAIALLLMCWVLVRLNEPVSPFHGWTALSVAGVTLILLAVFPYWVSGRSVTTFSWLTRNQLLLGFGISLIALAVTLGVSKLMGKRIALIFLAIVLAACILVDIFISRAYIRDWRKQQQLLALIANSADIQGADLIFFEDTTESNNIYSRRYTWFEWNALLYSALGDEKRFGVSESFHLQQYLDGQLNLQFTEDATTRGAIGHLPGDDGLLVEVIGKPSQLPWNFPT